VVKLKGPHHRGSYQVTAARVRAIANADPATTCWRCGLTLAEIRLHRNPKARWTAGHLNDGQVGGPLAPECSPCNYGAGATHGNNQRRRTTLAW
jgi:hypothetical protein